MAKNKKTDNTDSKSGGAVAAKAGSGESVSRPRVGPFKFLQQVRQEGSKVTWPTRNETFVTTVMVFIMVTLAALFFLFVDQIFGAMACRWVLNSDSCSIFGFDF